jgi:hypothetical protein
LRSFAAALLVSVIALAAPQSAAAFCGFYVTGADSSLYANATMVVLMRDGTRTVLSMQNNYEGPPNAFALVIPVPAVLQKEQVKVLPKDVFQKIDALSAPRLVEYWEVDPCQPQYPRGATGAMAPAPNAPTAAGAAGSASSVRIEAQFAVGEYDIVILSADDSTSLNSWLIDNKYNIPDGAEPVLAPYVAAGMKFFVAKVDVGRVTFNGDQAALSPLRFYYDTPEFSLPVRLGLLNSQGSQDLIVNILAPQRYELANYPNVTIPTNIRVQNEVRNSFGAFYESLYSKVLEKNPKAVVTEYAWAASSCDPCPTPPLDQVALATLGADVLQQANGGAPVPAAGSGALPPVNPSFGFASSFTLTRLHARYTKDSLGEDLVFQPASGLVGGQGIPDMKGMLNQQVQMSPGGYSSFQGRYVILHPWEGAISCASPQRGYWGGPSGTMGSAPQTQAPTNAALMGAAPTAGDLTSLIAESIPSLSVNARTPLDPLVAVPAKPVSSGTAGASPIGTAGPVIARPIAAAGSGTKSPGAAGQGVPGTPIDSPNPTPKDSGCSMVAGHSGNPLGLASVILGLALFSTRQRRRRGLARGER